MAHTQDALACEMVRSQFGDVVAEVVRILLAAPGTTLPQLVLRAAAFCDKRDIPGDTPIARRGRIVLVRDALAVLVQHAIVHAVERMAQNGKDGKGGTEPPDPAVRFRTVFSYYVKVENVMFRARLPLYLGFARRRYGDVGAAAVRAYFEHGRLTTFQVFVAVLDKVLQEMDITVSDAEACLVDMARSGLLHWSGRRNDEPPVLGKGAEGDKVVGNAAKEGDCDDVPLASLMAGKKRPRSPTPNGTVENPPDAQTCNGGAPPSQIQVGRGHHVRLVGAPTRTNDHDIWTICFRHLNREFRNECCALVAQGRISNELSVRILRAGLQIALEAEDCEAPSDDFETAEVDASVIQKHLSEQDDSVRDHEFWDSVQLLLQQNPPIVFGIPEHAPSKLKFVPAQLVSDARQKTLEDLVLTRYGAVGRRVFRALAIDGGMEEKVLAEKCMLPLKVAREYIFRMYRDRIIMMQEVPRSHDQQRASNWYYLWKVNPLAVCRNMTDVMYKTMLNLYVRLESLNREKPLTDAEKKQIAVHKELLMGSILRMDQSIMVMRDFGPVTSSYFQTRYQVVDGPLGKAKKRR